MKNISKEEFYRQRGDAYQLIDPEAEVRYRRALKWLKLKNGLVVGEAGCKFAVLSDLLSGHISNFEYVGVDIDQRTLDRVGKKKFCKFICYNVNNGLPFPDSHFDYIFCMELMEHLENPSFFLDEVNRTLRTDGRLVISVPNAYCWMEMLQNYKKRGDTEGHISAFSYLNMDALTRFVGLKIYAMQGTSTRVPLSKRIFGTYKIRETDNFFLTRSFMYLIGK